VKETGYIAKSAWKAFVEGLSARYRVYAPCKEGETVSFRRLEGERNLCLDRPAAGAPKAALLPQSETLFGFVLKKDATDPRKTEVELRADIEEPPTIILAGRPCDARGFTIIDPVFLDVDPYYRKRRERTTLITIACARAYQGCFCTSVGGGPADRAGSDVLLTELDQGYYVELLSDKGREALKDAPLEDGAPYGEEAERRQRDVFAQVKRAFPGGRDLKVSAERFESDQFWQEVSAKCLSCGACTFLCPTCYCFNITDEQGVDTGERIRSWDSCMFAHFTLEASGHNPRPHKSQRLKQRVGHKFVYHPEKYGEPACSGCGRCIRFCPVSMEISGIVAALAAPVGLQTEETGAGGEEAHATR
jgi:ferredoxin